MVIHGMGTLLLLLKKRTGRTPTNMSSTTSGRGTGTRGGQRPTRRKHLGSTGSIESHPPAAFLSHLLERRRVVTTTGTRDGSSRTTVGTIANRSTSVSTDTDANTSTGTDR